MKRKTLILCSMVVLVMVLLAGCVPGDGANTADNPAGFFWGIWHGWIAPISLILGLFKENIRIYETANKGWWYDFGFYIAVISGFGGISLFRKKNSGKK